MEAKDLRIGNLIQYNEGEECKVIGIHEFGIDVEFPEETTYIEYDQFSPIPLTEEWLLKFGFREFHHGWIEKKPLSFNKSSLACFISNEYGNLAINDKIKTVHQLQNLYFALTGEELIIKQLAKI